MQVSKQNDEKRQKYTKIWQKIGGGGVKTFHSVNKILWIIKKFLPKKSKSHFYT